MNLQNIIDNVRIMSARPNLPDNFIRLAVTNTEGEFNRRFRRHPRNLILSTYTLPTVDEDGNPVPATDLLSVPTNLAELVQLSDDDGIYNQYPRGTSTPSRGYLDRGNIYQVFPFPSDGQSFYMDYHSFIPPLVELNDRNWISEYFSDLYIYGAIKELVVMLKQDARMQALSNEFTKRMASTELQGDWQNIASTPRIRNA